MCFSLNYSDREILGACQLPIDTLTFLPPYMEVSHFRRHVMWPLVLMSMALDLPGPLVSDTCVISDQGLANYKD